MSHLLKSGQVVIGLEVHARLMTQSKLFSDAPSQSGGVPNTHLCSYDIAMPGTLPVLNKRAVELAIRFALATGAQLHQRSIFVRKHYHYPDLPKGYQISQFKDPIITGGEIPIYLDQKLHHIALNRAHLEEDAGKLVHENMPAGLSGVDLNRAGTPLLEIVSEPHMHSAQEAISYLKSLHAILVHSRICDGNLQDGSFRCDVNISITPSHAQALGTRCELKNINSFRFIHQAIEYEIKRQSDLLAQGKSIVQQTRGFDSNKGITFAMRDKEDAVDYRYFPDPDLPPLMISEAMIERTRADLPLSKWQRIEQFTNKHKLTEDQAEQLALHPDIADFFSACMDQNCDPVSVFKWITQTAFGYVQKHKINFCELKISPHQLADLLVAEKRFSLSHHQLKDLFIDLCDGKGEVEALLSQKGLRQKADSNQIDLAVSFVIDHFKQQALEYRSGNQKVGNFLVGKIMAQLKGGVDVRLVREKLAHSIAKIKDEK